MPWLVRRLLSKGLMPKIIPMNPTREPRFKFTVHHRRLEPMIADADRPRRQAPRKMATPARQVPAGTRQDD